MAWRGNHPGFSLVISDTHTFSPALVNEVKLGYSRDLGRWRDPNYGKDVMSIIGLEGIDNPENDPALSGMPGTSFSGSAVDFAGTITWANDWLQAQNTYQVIDNLSWYRGRHSLKLGFDVRRYQINDHGKPLEVRGSFNFDDQLSGFSYANFLLGYPSFATKAIARPAAYPRSTSYGFYMQDDFKLHPRITLTYGIRYEYYTPWVDKYDRMFTFDPDRASLVTAGSSIPTDLVPQVAATLPIITAAEAGLPLRSLMENDANNWSPRVGLAIRPFGDTKTVVRLGWGYFSQMWPGLLALNATGGPWQSTEVYYIEGNQPTISFPNPFLKVNEFSGVQSVSAVSSRFPNERSQQWSFSIGRQIWGTVVDIGYVGTSAKNIPFVQDLNQLWPSTIPYSSDRLPYQGFGSVNFTQSGASSIYHGLTIEAERRMATGLWFNANYAWAKALTDADLRSYSASPQQNQYARYLERGDDPNHRRQVLRFSYIYELPFGKGKPFASDVSGITNLLIGGWQLSGITTMLTGARLSPTFSGADPANTNQFSGRPDRIGDGNFDSGSMRDRIKSGQPILDINAFVAPEHGRGSFGNSARSILTGPGTANWNVVLAKNFPLFRERARLQIRWELFHALNRPNFWNPDTDISGGNFGMVYGAEMGRQMLFAARIDY